MPPERVRLTVGPLETNCYLLGDREGGQAAVIDPGDETWRILDELAGRRWELRWLLITHAHFDHIAGCGELARKTGCQIALHPADLPLWWMQGGSQLFRLSIPSQPEPTHALKAGERIAVGGLRLDVLHLPGHTPGHVGFLLAEEGWLFSGDVIFAEGGMGRTDLPGANETTLRESIREKILRLPDATVILPGHGEETSVALERPHWQSDGRR
jgi:hydroxyacylglutathione hydrolase